MDQGGSSKTRGTEREGARLVELQVRVRNTRTRPGQHVALVGAPHPDLADWTPTRSSSWMKWLGHGVWCKTLLLPPGSVHEIKFAVATESEVVEWQDGPNRILTVPDQPSEVHASWARTKLMVRPLMKPAPDGSLPMRIMTFNCRFDTARDGVHKWSNRKDGYIRGIADQHPDFFGVQESLHHQVQDICQGLPWYDKLGRGRDDGRESGEYSPVFYLKTKYHCVESGQFWLSETPFQPGSKSWRSACCRVCSWGRFEVIEESFASVYVFNTHLDHESSQAQVEGAKVIMRQMRQILERNGELNAARVVVTGDMNVDTNDNALKAFTDNLQTFGISLNNAVSVSREAKRSSGTFTGWSKRSEGITIDHIFLRTHGGDQACSLKLMVVDRYEVGTNVDPKTGGLVTDHRPVIVDVRLLP